MYAAASVIVERKEMNKFHCFDTEIMRFNRMKVGTDRRHPLNLSTFQLLLPLYEFNHKIKIKLTHTPE